MKTTESKIKGISFGVLLAGKVHDGSKTVTRRVVKEQADDRGYMPHGIDLETWNGEVAKCSYQIGQILYVREPWQVGNAYDKPNGSDHIPDNAMVNYLSDKVQIGMLGRRRIARFMPRRFARTFIQVTGVRCERLGAIDRRDAIREGIGRTVWNGWVDYSGQLPVGFNEDGGEINSFLSLWDAVNGKDAHLQNPWVWVIEFEKVEMPNPWNESLPWKPTWTKCDGEWLYGNRDHVLGCDFAMTVKYDQLSTAWDYSVSICGKETDSGYGLTADEAKENAVKAYRKSSKGIAPHLL